MHVLLTRQGHVVNNKRVLKVLRSRMSSPKPRSLLKWSGQSPVIASCASWIGSPQCMGIRRSFAWTTGLEKTCGAIAFWCRFSSTASAFIEPGAPWQNAFVESFDGELRDELLAIDVVHTLLDAKVMAEDYRQNPNTYRRIRPSNTEHQASSR